MPTMPANTDPVRAMPLQNLRRIGWVEGMTLVALVLVAVPLKHLADWPHAVTWLGPIHGVVFLLYLMTLIEAWSAGLLKRSGALRALVACFVPFGTFVNDRMLRRRQGELRGAGELRGTRA